MTLYGGGQLAMSVPVHTGAVVNPAAPARDVLAWHVFVWEPFWLLGGLLFLLMTAIHARRTRPSPAAA